MLPIIILAGGLGTRLGSLSSKIPKVLIPVNGKPFIEFQLDWLIRNHVLDVTYCVGHLGDQVIEYISTLEIPDWMQITFYSDGATQLGTGGAVLRALDRIEGKFLVTYGDSYLEASLSEISHEFTTSELPVLMTVYKNENRFDMSNIEFKVNQVTKYQKNDTNSDFQYIDYGILGFEKNHFSQFKEHRNFDLSLVIQSAIGNMGVFGFEIQERFFEIGSIQGLGELEIYLTKKGTSKNKSG